MVKYLIHIKLNISHIYDLVNKIISIILLKYTMCTWQYDKMRFYWEIFEHSLKDFKTFKCLNILNANVKSANGLWTNILKSLPG